MAEEIDQKPGEGSATSFMSKHWNHSLATPAEVCWSLSLRAEPLYVTCTRVWLSTETSSRASA